MSSRVNQPSADFDLYGLHARIAGDWADVVSAIRLDFDWFESHAVDAPADVRVTVEHRAPDYDSLGDVRAAYVTPQHTVYRLDGRTAVDYGGVVSLVQAGGTHALVQGDDARLARRAAFDFLLARAHDHLDAHGLPRVLGLGLGGAQGSVLVLLPPGGGKTTLALRALKEDGIRFFSETSPLLDRKGRMHPFPFPLWVRGDSAEAKELPADHARRVTETNVRLLELAAFVDRVARKPQPLRHIVLAHRSLAHDSRLEPVGRAHALAPLLRQSVMGFSFGDAVRFLVRRGGARDPAKEQRGGERVGTFRAAGAATRAAVRARCAAAALQHALGWELSLGRDREGNWRALEQLLR